MARYFILEKYKGKQTRFTCPQCHKSYEFTRFINPNTGERLPEHVGICNRSDSCGYRYTATQYFHDNPEQRNQFKATPIIPEPIKPISYISQEIQRSTMNNYGRNNFYQFLVKLVGKLKADNIVAVYNIGTYTKWEGANIFWQFDIKGRIRTGKIMDFNPITGKRIHGKQNWIHKTINDNEYNLAQCLLGEHLLGLHELKDKPVGLVEGDKTAVVASLFSDKLIWLSTGSKNLFNPDSKPDKFKILKGRKVVIYPDLGLSKPNVITPFEEWTKKAGTLKHLGVDCIVSDFIEKRATQEERMEGLDIADFLIQEHFSRESI